MHIFVKDFRAILRIISVFLVGLTNCAFAAQIVYLNQLHFTRNFWSHTRMSSCISTTAPYHASRLHFMQGLFSQKSLNGIEVFNMWTESDVLLRCELEDVEVNMGLGVQQWFCTYLLNPFFNSTNVYLLQHNIRMGMYFGYNLYNPIEALKNQKPWNHHILLNISCQGTWLGGTLQLSAMPQIFGIFASSEQSTSVPHTLCGITFALSSYLSPRSALKCVLYSRLVEYSHLQISETSWESNQLTLEPFLSDDTTKRGVEFHFEYAFATQAKILLSYTFDNLVGSRPSIGFQWKSDGARFAQDSKMALRRPIEHDIGPPLTRYIVPDRHKELLHFVDTGRTLQEEKLGQTFAAYSDDPIVPFEAAKIWILMDERQRNIIDSVRRLSRRTSNQKNSRELLPAELRVPIGLYAYHEEVIKNGYIEDIFGAPDRFTQSEQVEIREAMSNGRINTLSHLPLIATGAVVFEDYGAARKTITERHLEVLWSHLKSFKTASQKKKFLQMKRQTFPSNYNGIGIFY